MADDDWQEATFSNRHNHNRVGKRGGKGRSSGGFDVKKAFGSYEIKSSKFQNGVGGLEIYGLNEEGNALLGELEIPRLVRGWAVLAGSRRTMGKVVRGLEDGGGEIQEAKGGKQVGAEDVEREGGTDGEDGSSEEDEDDDDEMQEKKRFDEFEKNSFRSPKFWVKWQGQVLQQQDQAEAEGENRADAEAEAEEVVTDDGYIVFKGNACEKFEGTLSSAKLGWKNIKIQGWKLKGLAARDVDVEWRK